MSGKTLKKKRTVNISAYTRERSPLKKRVYYRRSIGIKDAEGNITEIHCTYDPDSKSGSGSEASQRKVKGTIHWVNQATAVAAQVNLYDRLFQ